MESLVGRGTAAVTRPTATLVTVLTVWGRQDNNTRNKNLAVCISVEISLSYPCHIRNIGEEVGYGLYHYNDAIYR